jgi:Ner family transcriptional regulator
MTKKRSNSLDWHPADIVAAIRKTGTSMAELGRENGLANTTLRNALDKPYPRAEGIIAKAIGVEPSDIWPTRYIKPGHSGDKAA